jgi:hypothetical protein
VKIYTTYMQIGETADMALDLAALQPGDHGLCNTSFRYAYESCIVYMSDLECRFFSSVARPGAELY